MIERTLRRDLAATSRAFYLSLVFLPRSTRPAIALAYALARAADTIADTENVPRERRREHLERFLAAASGRAAASKVAAGLAADLAGSQGDPGERRLLENLSHHLDLLARLEPADRQRVESVLSVLVGGMRADLERFGGELASLETRSELTDYCYQVAGVVGEFWTEVHAAHLAGYARRSLPVLSAAGVRFGNGLQRTNILRDLPRDLAAGRCYLPRQDLDRLGLAPADLLRPGAGERLRPLLSDLTAETLDDYAHGFAYTLAIRRRHLRSRFSCALPLLIGVETLGLLAARPDPLDPGVVVKIGRPRVRRLVRRTLLRAASDRALAAEFRRALRAAGFEAAAVRELPDLAREDGR